VAEIEFFDFILPLQSGSVTATPVHGPAFAAIGWIPHRYLPPRGFQSLNPRLMFLASSMFLTGNSRPQASFVSGEQLSTFLESKEFRGALALERVELDSDGFRPIQLRFAGLKSVGYTPLPLPPRFRFSRRRYSFGESRPATVGEFEGWRGGLLPDGSGAYLIEKMEFRVGEPSRSIGRTITGIEVPYVTMSLRYEIRLNGTVTIYWRGSGVPSIDYHWEPPPMNPSFRLKRQYDMAELSEPGWSGFLAAGTDVPPLAPLDEVWNGKIS
jgi:hypothetical protein